jgi:PPK2 family polyphosphate:nucleotide phosphotransferase|tara:strand:+ start:1243 stop:2118 length:876 start_codon:yes stop_codon:yes gene_type:complete
MKNISLEQFKVISTTNLSSLATQVQIDGDDEVNDALKKTRKKLSKLQDTIYAHGKYSILICLQGMDTAGKDSLVREVFKDFNTRGIVVHSFKVPSEAELGHDYLWRHYIALPARGKFAVFNRTYYENVLITRVHPSYILNENLPGIHSVSDVDDAFWEQRFEQIRNFEKHLNANGTLIFKFFLNLSKSEQKNRLLRRIELKEKNWKFSPGDLKERKLWDIYQNCYQDAINKTATEHAPWYVIPADHKPSARYIVAKIIYNKLKDYTDIVAPELSEEIKEKLSEYKKELNEE